MSVSFLFVFVIRLYILLLFADDRKRTLAAAKPIGQPPTAPNTMPSVSLLLLAPGAKLERESYRYDN